MPEFTAVKDSGERRDFGTGSVRDVRTGKGRYDLLPAYPIKRIAQHFENGAAKYGDRNWQKGQPLSGYLDSGLRHTFSLLDGMTDEDHAAAAAWNLIAFIWTQREIAEGRLPAELDDMARPAGPTLPDCCKATDGCKCGPFGDPQPRHHTDCGLAYGLDSCRVCGGKREASA